MNKKELETKVELLEEKVAVLFRRVSVLLAPQDFITCPKCNGEGLHEEAYFNPCWLSSEPLNRIVDCELCDGIGKIRERRTNKQDRREKPANERRKRK